MVIKKMKFENFRNIKSLEINPHENVNVIYGDNGQGKTNIIEGIWIFSGNQSFRSGKMNEFINFDSEFFRNEIIFEDNCRENKAEILVNQKKIIKLNNVILKSSTELSESFFCVMFSPCLLSFVQGSPKERRKFLNIAISQINSQYKSYFSTYEKLIEQRNALLKSEKNIEKLKENIDVWDIQIAKIGTIISIYRNDYIKKLLYFAKKNYNEISNEKEDFSLKYISTVFDDIDKILVYDDMSFNLYYQKLKENFMNDFHYGSTTVGIHRDDLEILIKKVSARLYASQGQQRSAVISIKLAESMLIKKIMGQQPIMLLDDVLSELDEKRQDYILNNIKNSQVFITCCDNKNFINMKEGKLFHIENGKVLQ